MVHTRSEELVAKKYIRNRSHQTRVRVFRTKRCGSYRERGLKSKHEMYLIRGSVGAFKLYFYPSASEGFLKMKKLFDECGTQGSKIAK